MKAVAVIPPKRNRIVQHLYEKNTYKMRNLIEEHLIDSSTGGESPLDMTVVTPFLSRPLPSLPLLFGRN